MMDVPTKRQLEDSTDEVFCVPCSGASQQIPARGFCQECMEYLCGVCYNRHATSAITASHRLQDDAAMPRPGPVQEKVPRRSAGPLNCPEHPETAVDVFCMSHNIAVCGPCASDSHIPYCNTENISEVATRFHKGTDYKNLTELFGNLETKIAETMNKAMANVSQAKNNYNKDFLSKVETDCRQFEVELTNQKTELSKHEHSDKELYVVSQLAKVNLRSIEMHIDHFLKQIYALESGEDLHNPDATTASEVAVEQDDKESTQPGDANQDIREPSAQKEAAPSDEKTSDKKDRIINRLDAAVLEKLYDLKWKIPSEFDNTWDITGMIFVGPDQLFLVDKSHSQLKRINTTTNKITSVKLNYRPYDITALYYNRIVITMPWSNEIRFYDPTPKELKFVSYSKLSKMPLSISATTTMLVISYNYKPARLEVLDYMGKYQYTISPVVDGKPLFINPLKLRVTQEKQGEIIYVSDPDAKCVSAVAMNGVVYFVYRDPMLSDPRGLAFTYGKQLLIASYRENSIHLVSHDGKKIRTLIDEADGITRPVNVTLSHDEHRIYVSNDYGRGVLAFKIL